MLITLCVLVTAGMAACLYLFLSAKRDLFEAEKRLGRELGSLRQRLEEQAEAPPPAAPRPALNITTRSQALRLARRGDRPDQIAAALSIPLREVDLLLKVQQLSTRSPCGP